MAALNTAQTQQHQRTPNVASTRAFVREIRLILQTRLPTELAMAIIDLAELRSHTIEIYRETERNGFPKRYSELSNRIAYISVLIPISDVHTLKQIEFYMKSRDQGESPVKARSWKLSTSEKLEHISTGPLANSPRLRLEPPWVPLLRRILDLVRSRHQAPTRRRSSRRSCSYD